MGVDPDQAGPSRRSRQTIKHEERDDEPDVVYLGQRSMNDYQRDDMPDEKPARKRRRTVKHEEGEEALDKKPISKRAKVFDLGEERSEQDKKPARRKAKVFDEEKRLKRFRVKAPLSYNEIRERALSQRMFVLDRVRSVPDEDSSSSHPIETLTIAGTTGNVYTVTIDKLPSCTCPHARKGNQCKHIVYALARVLRARQDLQYQLAFLSAELCDIFDNAPPLPSATGKDTTKDGNRKPLEDCPICCEDFEEAEKEGETVVWCKAACGNNIHKACFNQWAATKRGGSVTCPFCRTPWATSEEDLSTLAKVGKVNNEGYVNVAGQLGLSGQRDYSSYNQYWVRRYLGGWD
ncbi:unnamed protein product [Zymoseptoria tritici ST99CH_1A5]|uniref:Anaphase-promoting complex subunit 11 n=2 Tax=Zymoseptoria tritici TaxID=1047171 RepID=A0A2H1H7T0_ZYMTR|nr:unnamed protein product [Zymoseptoria tritici ST99CH_1E4]SMR64359.1 unnamed protein product [Zymoseptoria tritici ST99CH_3D1]SMY29704.1 unnamed protein product [Zymoseptoria tritici ST99CH_1A5]